MRLIKEPLEIDFFVDARPLTKKEANAISDFIRADKARRKNSIPEKQTTKPDKQKL